MQPAAFYDIVNAMQEPLSIENPVLFVVGAMLAFFALIVLAVFALLARPWLRALLHGTPVPLIHILTMRLRGNPPVLLIDAYIKLKRAGVSATIGEVENVYIDSRTRVSTSGDLVGLVKASVNAGWGRN